MRIVVVLAALAALGACSTPITIEQAQAQLAAAPDYQLCQTAILGNPDWARLADEQRRSRGLDCAPYVQSIVAQDAARRQMAMQYLMAQPQATTYQVPMPVPVQAPRQVNCTSQRIGSQVQTSCY